MCPRGLGSAAGAGFGAGAGLGSAAGAGFGAGAGLGSAAGAGFGVGRARARAWVVRRPLPSAQARDSPPEGTPRSAARTVAER